MPTTKRNTQTLSSNKTKKVRRDVSNSNIAKITSGNFTNARIHITINYNGLMDADSYNASRKYHHITGNNEVKLKISLSNKEFIEYRNNKTYKEYVDKMITEYISVYDTVYLYKIVSNIETFTLKKETKKGFFKLKKTTTNIQELNTLLKTLEDLLSKLEQQLTKLVNYLLLSSVKHTIHNIFASYDRTLVITKSLLEELGIRSLDLRYLSVDGNIIQKYQEIREEFNSISKNTKLIFKHFESKNNNIFTISKPYGLELYKTKSNIIDITSNKYRYYILYADIKFLKIILGVNGNNSTYGINIKNVFTTKDKLNSQTLRNSQNAPLLSSSPSITTSQTSHKSQPRRLQRSSTNFEAASLNSEASTPQQSSLRRSSTSPTKAAITSTRRSATQNSPNDIYILHYALDIANHNLSLDNQCEIYEGIKNSGLNDDHINAYINSLSDNSSDNTKRKQFVVSNKEKIINISTTRKFKNEFQNADWDGACPKTSMQSELNELNGESTT